jgi:hypothetical protein
MSEVRGRHARNRPGLETLPSDLRGPSLTCEYTASYSATRVSHPLA